MTREHRKAHINIYDLAERIAHLMKTEDDTFYRASRRVYNTDKIPGDQWAELNREVGKILNLSKKRLNPTVRMVKDAATWQRSEERRAGQSYEDSDIVA